MNQDFLDLLRAFIDRDVRFLIVGAYALAVHGRPRATGDLDVWVDATPENAAKVMSALEQFGAPTAQVRAEDFSRPGIVFEMGLPPVRIDVLTQLSGLTFGRHGRHERERPSDRSWLTSLVARPSSRTSEPQVEPETSAISRRFATEKAVPVAAGRDSVARRPWARGRCEHQPEAEVIRTGADVALATRAHHVPRAVLIRAEERPAHWLRGLAGYFSDTALHEKLLLERYEKLLLRLDKAIGAAAAASQ